MMMMVVELLVLFMLLLGSCYQGAAVGALVRAQVWPV